MAKQMAGKLTDKLFCLGKVLDDDGAETMMSAHGVMLPA